MQQGIQPNCWLKNMGWLDLCWMRHVVTTLSKSVMPGFKPVSTVQKCSLNNSPDSSEFIGTWKLSRVSHGLYLGVRPASGVVWVLSVWGCLCFPFPFGFTKSLSSAYLESVWSAYLESVSCVTAFMTGLETSNGSTKYRVCLSTHTRKISFMKTGVTITNVEEMVKLCNASDLEWA